MNLNRIKYTPDNFDPRRGNVSAFDITPAMSLPSGKIYNAPRGINTIEQLTSRGVNAISGYQTTDLSHDQLVSLAQAGKTYAEVAKTPTVLNLPAVGPDEWVGSWPNSYNKKYFPNGPLTYEQGYAKGQQASTFDRTQIFETQENTHAMALHWPMWGGFFDAFMPRMQAEWIARGLVPYVSPNYFDNVLPNDWTLNTGDDRAVKKAFLQKTIGQMPNTLYSPGGTLSTVPLICEGVYWGAPDTTKKYILKLIYKMLAVRAMGKTCMPFLFGKHEYRPNNLFRINYDDGGRLYASDKMPLNPNHVSNCAIAGMAFGGGLIGWGNGGKSNTKKLQPNDYGQTRKYFPPGSNVQNGEGPVAGAGDSKFYGYDGTADFVHFGVTGYNKSFGKTVGVNPTFPDIKIDNGAYRSGHVVDAFLDDSVMCYTERNGNLLSWMILDAVNANVRKTVTFQDHTGTERTTTICSNSIHLGLEVLN